MADLVKKKIWMRVKRQDISCDGIVPSCEMFCVDVQEGETGPEIKNNILHTCNLCHLNNIVLKLRNHRDSLIPITSNIPTNSSSRPYSLEVVNVHQNIEAKPRSVLIPSCDETMKGNLTVILQRLEKLEEAAPELSTRRNDKINNEMKEVDQMLDFLYKRIQDAEAVKWKGMFKKNPLW